MMWKYKSLPYVGVDGDTCQKENTFTNEVIQQNRIAVIMMLKIYFHSRMKTNNYRISTLPQIYFIIIMLKHQFRLFLNI